MGTGERGTASGGEAPGLGAPRPVPDADPSSRRPGVDRVKRAVGRLSGWQLVPLAARTEDLEARTAAAIDRVERRLGAIESRLAHIDERLIPVIEEGVRTTHAADREIARRLADLHARLDRLEGGEADRGT